MADINDLLVRIDASTELLRREMKRAEQTTDRSTSKMNRFLGRLDRRFASMNQAASRARAAIGAVITALAIRRGADYVRTQIRIADAIGKSAQVAGVSAEQIQELRFAFGQLAGTQDREVDESLRRFNRRLGLAIQGNKAYADTFKDLGVEMRDSGGQLRVTSVVLEDTLRALARVQNDATRAAMASQVFGEDAGPRLAAALKPGIKAVDDLRASLREQGGIISNENIERAAELNDQFDRIGRTITAQTADAILENAEAIEDLAIAIGKASSAAVGATANVTDFTRWLGEELAARLHGVAADDLPRLTQRLREASDQLARMEEARSKLSDSWWDRGSRNSIDAALQKQRELVASLERQLEVAKRLNAEARSAPSTGTRGVPAPAIHPSVKVLDPFDVSMIQTRATPRTVPAVDEARRFYEMTRTETEQIRAQIERVQELASKGFFQQAGIDDEQVLARLKMQLAEVEARTGDASRRMGEALASNVGGAIDELFATGKLSASSFADAVLRDLLRITTQLYVMKPLIEGIFGAGGGGSSFGRALFSSFGFAKGGSFRVGGSGGPDSQFVPLRLTPGENVTVSPPGRGAASSVQVNVINQGEPLQVQQTHRRQSDGQQIIDVMVERSVGNMFATGSMDRLFAASGMNVRRRGT